MAENAEMSLNTRSQIICANAPHCGFRVGDRYFQVKKRFSPGICPNCNGAVVVVEPYTSTPMPGARVNIDPGVYGSAGQVLYPDGQQVE